MRSLLYIILVLIVSCTNTKTADKIIAADYRPIFHFTPDSNWINDPNGLVYYNNEYHLFYQHNPFGNKWGHMSWGHSTSKDLLSWKPLPLAIPEYPNADSSTTWIFSGTAVVDSFNTAGFGTKEHPMPLIAIYNSHVDKGKPLAQHQSLAYSLDGTTFTRFAGNPILDIHSIEFRDPKVFWHSPSHKWVMIVSKPDQKKVHFYESKNLKEWKFMSEFGPKGNTTHVWECPDIFEMPVENSAEKKWVVTLSAGHPVDSFFAMQYFIGNFDGQKFSADSLPYPLYLDNGKDFYAGITFNNLPAADNRRIMIGWANCWEYANDIPTTGFRGMMAIPRELKLGKNATGQPVLLQLPVKEVNNFRGKLLYQKENLPLADAKDNAGNSRGDALDLEFTLARKDAAAAGIKLFKNGEEETLIYYERADNTIRLDRRKSGNTSFSKKFPGMESIPAPAGNNDIIFRILIDKSLVEVFINGGEQAFTDQVYPTDSNGQIEFFSKGGAALFKNISIWEMKSSMK